MGEYLVCSESNGKLDGIPEEIKILPLGQVKSQKGDFVVDNESVQMILEYFKNRHLDIVIDYEHQTLENVQAPAGGWIKELKQGKDSLLAKVEWTPKAKEYLKNKEYRYLSPVVAVREKDKKAAYIHSVALTNTPAIDGMYAIVNSWKGLKEKEGGTKMELEQLIELLGLPEGTTPEELETKLKELKKVMDEAEKKEEANKEELDKKQEDEKEELVANSTVLGLLGLGKNAKTEDVVTEIMKFKNDGTAEEVRKLKEKMQKKEAEELVNLALKDGKIAANQKEWATQYALKDSDGFEKFVAAAPRVVPVGQIEYAPTKSVNADELNLKALKDMGISEEEIKKYVN